MRPNPRLARWIDRLHLAVIIFWLTGFALYWHYPDFRRFHAWFIVVGALHQILLGNRCILTIWSDALYGEHKPKEPYFIGRFLAGCGIVYPQWINSILTGLTVLAAVLTLLFWH